MHQVLRAARASTMQGAPPAPADAALTQKAVGAAIAAAAVTHEPSNSDYTLSSSSEEDLGLTALPVIGAGGGRPAAAEPRGAKDDDNQGDSSDEDLSGIGI